MKLGKIKFMECTGVFFYKCLFLIYFVPKEILIILLLNIVWDKMANLMKYNVKKRLCF